MDIKNLININFGEVVGWLIFIVIALITATTYLRGRRTSDG